jgi:hypothetical protein
MAAKRPIGAYPKASKKANAKRVFEAGVKSGKVKSVEAGMTGAMVAKVAGKVISKVAPKASQAAKREKIMGKVKKQVEDIKIATTIAKKPGSSVKVVKPQGKASRTFRNEKEAERLTRNPMPKSTPKSGRGSARPDSEVAKIKISENVTARVPKKSNYDFAKDMSTIGKIQKQNAGPLKATKAEVKANARALKAANKKKK